MCGKIWADADRRIIQNCLHGRGVSAPIDLFGSDCAGLGHPTAMGGNQGIDDGPVSVEGAKRADLILPHEAAVAFHIGGEDRG